MVDLKKLKAGLARREAKRHNLYKDTLGNWTIGVGHNLTAKGLSDEAIDFILDEDISDAYALLDTHLAWWRKEDDVRARVMIELAFNMGGKLLGFKNTLREWRAGNHDKAADMLGDSLWAHQVDDGIGGRIGRADVLVGMLRTGKDPVL